MGEGQAEAAVSMPGCIGKSVSTVQGTYADLQRQLGVASGSDQPPLSWVDKNNQPYYPTKNDDHTVVDQSPSEGTEITTTTALTFTVQTSSR